MTFRKENNKTDQTIFLFKCLLLPLFRKTKSIKLLCETIDIITDQVEIVSSLSRE